MKYAFVESGVVVEVVRVDPFGIFNTGYASKFVEVPDEVEPGWMYEGGSFYQPPVEPEPVPISCTRRQGLLALLSYGFKRSDIEAQIETIEDEMEREAAWIEYLADTWELGNPRLQAMWAALGGTPEQLPDLFRLAVTL